MANIDDADVARFSALASKWWDPNGEFRALHKLAPARMAFVRDAVCEHFSYDEAGGVSGAGESLAADTSQPLAGLSILDIGCGGGLVAEPLARMGANVSGIDPSVENIEAARAHAEIDDLNIEYQATNAEALAETGATFDVVTCLEVIEHVPDKDAFLRTCAALVAPGGLLILSTLNRTLKSYGLAIVAAEYVLDWVPRGTHDWNRFVSPQDLGDALASIGLERPKSRGISYNPIGDSWRLSNDLSVNYISSSGKPAL